MGPGSEVEIGVRVDVLKAEHELKRLRRTLSGLSNTDTKKFATVAAQVARKQQEFATQTDKLNVSLGKIPFAGYALSVMFFGQAVQQVMTQIWRSSTKTFQDIMHSVEGTVTGFDILNGEITYLGFVVGDALEPIASFLTPIVESISNWVVQNEELARVFFIIASVLGTVVALGGFLKLAFDGFAGALGVVTPLITGLKAALAGIGPVGWLIVAVIAAIAIAWKTNLGDIHGYIKAFWDNLVVVVKSLFKNLWNIFGGFIEFIEGIFTGDFEKVMSGLITIVQNVLAAVVKAFVYAFIAIYNFIAFMINSAVDIILGNLRLIISSVEYMLSLINKVTGKEIFDLSAFTTAYNALDKLQESVKFEYAGADFTQKALDNVDRLFGVSVDKPTDSTSGTTYNNQSYVFQVNSVDDPRFMSVIEGLEKYK